MDVVDRYSDFAISLIVSVVDVALPRILMEFW